MMLTRILSTPVQALVFAATMIRISLRVAALIVTMMASQCYLDNKMTMRTMTTFQLANVDR